MNETDYNARLYEKMKAEQDKYRDWLLHQEPSEILNHTYEYTMREDIVMCIRSSGTEKPSIWIPSGTPSKRKRIRACNGRRRNSTGKAGDFMPYIPPEVVEQARQIDLLTYLQSCEPQELVRISGNNYTTRTHDSLKISNGKWMWWSQRIGGYNALDYLVKVKGCSFVEAVETLMGKAAVMPSTTVKPKQKTEPRILLLPDKSASTERITEYLFGRGIDYAVIQYCIDKGLIFESLPYHNLVCVGFDEKNSPRYASFRATNDRRVLGDCSGSDKHYSFRVADSDSSTVHLFECAIDLLSFATLERMAGVMMNNTPKKENAAIELFSGFGNSDFRMKIGGTVYEVSTHFDPEGSRCVLQQFRDLILSEELLENRIIAENAKAQ